MFTFRQRQWVPPTWEGAPDDVNMDLRIPIHDVPKTQQVCLDTGYGPVLHSSEHIDFGFNPGSAQILPLNVFIIVQCVADDGGGGGGGGGAGAGDGHLIHLTFV